MKDILQSELQDKIEQEDFDKLSIILLKSFLLPDRHSSFQKQEELLSYFQKFLIKFFEIDYFASKKDKLEIIHIIDKLKLQLELIELFNKQNASDVAAAGDRLGKKAQSGFGEK